MGGALLVALLLQAADLPDYPLGPLPAPEMTRSERRLTLTDLHYFASDSDSTSQALSVRARLGTWAFLGAEIDGERRAASFATYRFDAAFADNSGQYDARLGFHGRRLRLGVDASRRGPGQDNGWTLDTAGAFRLGPDLELTGGYFRDTDPSTPRPLRTRPLTRVSAGFLYQRASVLDLGAAYAHATLRTEAGFDAGFDRIALTASGLLQGAQLDGETGFERTGGRLSREEVFGRVNGLVPLGSHVLLQAIAGTSWEPGLARFEQELRGVVTYHSRRIRLARAGEAARRTLALARRANELGLNQRRSHDLEGRRELREQLALSSHRDELAAEIDALYREQVAERNVIQAGIDVSDTWNDVRGTSGNAYRVFVGVPWPAGWPWSQDEGSVAFLRASFLVSELRYANGLTSVAREAALEVALNREMSLYFRWRKPGRSPNDVIRETTQPRTLELEYAYTFGR